jgi:hypothetical protein
MINAVLGGLGVLAGFVTGLLCARSVYRQMFADVWEAGFLACEDGSRQYHNPFLPPRGKEW